MESNPIIKELYKELFLMCHKDYNDIQKFIILFEGLLKEKYDVKETLKFLYKQRKDCILDAKSYRKIYTQPQERPRCFTWTKKRA